MQTLRLILVLACLGLIAGAAQAQIATALVSEGEPVPEAPEYFVASISGPAVTGADGWAFNCNTNYESDTVAIAYGVFPGMAMPAILAREIATDVYIQNNWEGFFGMADDGISNSASCTRIADGEDGLDSVWLDDVVVAIEQEPYPHMDGWFWSFGSRPSATRDGQPYFVGGITDSQGGSTQNRGLFYGFDNTPLVLGGMMIDGLPDPVVNGSAAVSFDYRISAYGTNWLAEVATETGSSTNDNNMVSNGALLLIDGMAVSEGSPVPESAGGLPGENWDNFDFCGITEDGEYLFTGDTDADSAIDEFVCLNGVIILREGDEIDGMVLSGSIESGYLNEQGDWAVVWDVDTIEGNIEALIFNGAIMLTEGMPVDIDGDGMVNEETYVTNFTGISALAVADRDDQGRAGIFFTADVEVPGPGPAPRGVTLPASEADGLEEDYVEEAGTRFETEFGLRILPEGTVAIDPEDLPGDEAPALRLALDQNYPNPFNPQTSIVYSLTRAGQVHLSVFDVQGRLVRTLVSATRASGSHTAVWNGTDERGQAVPAGTYVYRLTTDERVLSRTMVLVK